jgi:ubiquinone/menaquinone biosynthesis C-methylase UbiE
MQAGFHPFRPAGTLLADVHGLAYLCRMDQTPTDNRPEPEEWFRDWFDELYLQVYAHRDRAEAEELVEWIGTRYLAEAEMGIVDLACGAGRHAWAMSEWGWEITGLDLSMPLLTKAKEFPDERKPRMLRPRFVRGDLRRLPLRDESFGLGVNLFTSFGYFQTDSEHQAALVEMARVLREGGLLLLDLANATHLRATLVPEDHSVLNKMEIVQRRRLVDDGKRVEKDMEISLPGGKLRRVHESVRLFEPAEIEQMCGRAGFTVEGVTGGYGGQTFQPSESSRMIVAARKQR